MQDGTGFNIQDALKLTGIVRWSCKFLDRDWIHFWKGKEEVEMIHHDACDDRTFFPAKFYATYTEMTKASAAT